MAMMVLAAAAAPAQPLSSDPTLQWHTFLGGTFNDLGFDVAVDEGGNVYLAGMSAATWGNPERPYNGPRDAFVAKLDTNGELLWTTFLGGAGLDDASGIAVDASGSVYVTGLSTATWGSPVHAHAEIDGYDAYVAKLDSSGALLWHTFMGGSEDELGMDIALGGSGNIYLVGLSHGTWGSPVRPYAANFDAFAAKLDGGGTLQWHTFLGSSGTDFGFGIAVDPGGNAYVAGRSDRTWGAPLRTYASGSDGFAAKLDAGGELVWNTFLGATSDDSGNGIAVDDRGDVFVVGHSQDSWGSPARALTPGLDAFVAKLNTGGGLLWNTFLGGSQGDDGSAIAVTGSGDLYVTGRSFGTWGNPLRPNAGGGDAFAAKLHASGVLLWNTFLGNQFEDFGDGVAVDGSGAVLMVGSSEAPGWGSPLRPTSSGRDAFAAKLEGPADGVCAPSATAMCLNHNRFQVAASFRTAATAPTHQAPVVELTDDTGYLWFFNSTNVEVVVKVLDACAFPAAPRYWVFAAGLTNVEVIITVTDTKTGLTKTYQNPLHRAFQPVQDTNAFATCL